MTHATTRGLLVLALTAALAACGEPTQAPDAPPAAPVTLAAPVSSFAPITGAEAAPAGNCSLDAINGAPVSGASVVAGSEVMFGGWVADGAAAVPADAMLVMRGAQAYAVPLVAGVERPDVATALNSEQARLSGFNASARLDGVQPGEYGLSIVHTGSSASCDLKATLTVTQG